MSSSIPPHYVRLKRYNLTIFIHCDVNHDTVQAIKERYEKLTGRTFYNLRLYLGRQNLEDSSTLYNCGIESEGYELVVVHSKGQNSDGTSELLWEEIEEALNPPPKEERVSTSIDGEPVGDAQDNAQSAGQTVVAQPTERNLTFIEPNVDYVEA